MRKIIPTFLLCALVTSFGVSSILPLSASAQNLPTLGDTERDSLSPIMERKLGEEIMRDLRKNVDYLDDALVRDYLNKLGNNLLSSQADLRGEAQYDFFFFAVRDPMLNAFALPGGNIGLHSALIFAAQSESELASVISHEIGHVTQRHIARMLGQQKQDMLIPLAGVLLGILMARTGGSGDVTGALLAGSQGLALQRQLSFGRDAEREADRVGFQILESAGFDTSGMVNFFKRLDASHNHRDSVPPYLQTHPLNSERIADMDARVRSHVQPAHADSLDFYLIKSRVLLLQDMSTQGVIDARAYFENQLEKKQRVQTVAAKYGLALLALKDHNPARAKVLLDEAKLASLAPDNVILESLYLDILLSADYAQKNISDKHIEALNAAKLASARFPKSRSIMLQYVNALMLNKKYDDAVTALRDQILTTSKDGDLYELLAKAYASQGKVALQHITLADAYALSGSFSEALEQLNIARKAPDITLYDLEIMSVRQKQWREQLLEQNKEKGKLN